VGVPALSVAVVTYSRSDLLGDCLASLVAALATLGEAAEVLVVDTGSQSGLAETVAQRLPDATVLSPGHVGFAGAAVRAVAASSGEWIALLNDDVTVEPGALGALLEAGRSDDAIGSVAAQMRFADRPGVINSAGVVVDRLGVPVDRLLGHELEAGEAAPTEVFGASGGAALYRRAMLEDVGGFDESFFGYLEDVDVAWRARMAGWRCVYAPRAVVHHHHSASFGHRSPLKYYLAGRNRLRLLAKNADARLLVRHGPSIVAYELAYATFASIRDRTLAPIRGRLSGLADWRRYRRAGRDRRRPVELSAPEGIRGAVRRHRVWSTGDLTAGRAPAGARRSR
jgi:GT2 family glycosyltransferase